jgi:isochorismate synthase
LLNKLHPTPAVCGLPKKDAFDFIIENETHDRGFYAGYIGIETQSSNEYFVNLRCARFFSDRINLFVGGGITADSRPENEWTETELKSGTIMKALSL